MAGSLTAPGPNDKVVAGWTGPVTAFYNGLTTIYTATSNLDLSLTTSLQDVPNASVSVTVAGANAYALVFGTFLWQVIVAAAGDLKGDMNIDGSIPQPTMECIDTTANTYNFRTGTYLWYAPLAAGTHTIKLQAEKDAAGATASVKSSSRLIVIVFDLA